MSCLCFSGVSSAGGLRSFFTEDEFVVYSPAQCYVQYVLEFAPLGTSSHAAARGGAKPALPRAPSGNNRWRSLPTPLPPLRVEAPAAADDEDEEDGEVMAVDGGKGKGKGESKAQRSGLFSETASGARVGVPLRAVDVRAKLLDTCGEVCTAHAATKPQAQPFLPYN